MAFSNLNSDLKTFFIFFHHIFRPYLKLSLNEERNICKSKRAELRSHGFHSDTVFFPLQTVHYSGNDNCKLKPPNYVIEHPQAPAAAVSQKCVKIVRVQIADIDLSKIFALNYYCLILSATKLGQSQIPSQDMRLFPTLAYFVRKVEC